MSAAEIIGLGLLLAYWVFLILTRWMFIARPNRRFTLARIDDTQYELQKEPGGKDPHPLLDEAREIARGNAAYRIPAWREPPDAKVQSGEPRAPEERRGLRKHMSDLGAPLIWNGSRDLVAWMLMHQVQARSVLTADDAGLHAMLVQARMTVVELPVANQESWRAELETALDPTDPSKLGDEGRRELLSRYLVDLYDARDTKFVNLATQQNKVTWLVFVSLAVMGVLVSAGYERILLAGAVGGILSRLQREMQRRDVPSDYGLSWAALFLSPVAGALSAWAGLLVLTALQGLGVVDLESVLPPSTALTGEPPNSVLGLAVVLGISERFLQRIVQQVTKEITPDEDGKQPPTMPALPKPAPTPTDAASEHTAASQEGDARSR